MFNFLRKKKQDEKSKEKPIKFCKDCEYCVLDKKYPDFERQCKYAKCNSEESKIINLVCGGFQPYYFCSVERISVSSGCGPDGKYFKRKEDV